MLETLKLEGEPCLEFSKLGEIGSAAFTSSMNSTTCFGWRFITDFVFLGVEDSVEGGVGDVLLVSIYLWGGEGWGPVEEEGGITIGQADSQALVQVSDLV